MFQRYLTLLSAFLLFNIAAQAQVGINTTSPNAQAVLDLQSTSGDKGLLIPRMSEATRIGIAASRVLGPKATTQRRWNGTDWKPPLPATNVRPTAPAWDSHCGWSQAGPIKWRSDSKRRAGTRQKRRYLLFSGRAVTLFRPRRLMR